MNTQPTPELELEVAPAAYEAPAIESVMTPKELEREVFYAGLIVVSGQNPPPISF